MKPVRLRLAGALLLTVLPNAFAFAQSGDRPAHAVPETVVTATRIATPLDQIGASVTVITGEELKRRQYDHLADALREVPGLSVQQNGGPGRLTSVFTRGGNSNHTLVLMDGVPINDMADTSNAFNFGNMTTVGIDRIEIVRGPMSTLYGSQAIGGVINIITAKGKGDPKETIIAEAGSFRTFAEQANLRGAQGRFAYNMTASRFDTEGISVTPHRRRGASGVNPEPDGFHSTTVSGRFDAELSDRADLTYFTRYTGTRGDNDSAIEDPNSRDKSRYMLNKLQGSADLFDGLWKPTLAFSRYSVDRIDMNDFDRTSSTNRFTRNAGHRDKAEMQNDLYVSDGVKFVLGMERQHEMFTNREVTTSTRRSKATADTAAGYIQGLFESGDANLALAGRMDEHDAFGSHGTWRASPSLYVRESDTRLKAAYGTGFKAPSLYQLYVRTASFSGNPALLPEESRGYEAGIEQGFGKTLKGGTTFFRTDTKNLIVSNSNFSSSINLGSALARGLESFLAWKPSEAWTIRLDHTFQKSEDRSNGQELLRRPKHKLGLRADWQIDEDWEVGAGMHHSGFRADTDADRFTRSYHDGYWVARLTSSYRLSETWSIFGRVENAFNIEYEEPTGFARPRRAIFSGVKATF